MTGRMLSALVAGALAAYACPWLFAPVWLLIVTLGLISISVYRQEVRLLCAAWIGLALMQGYWHGYPSAPSSWWQGNHPLVGRIAELPEPTPYGYRLILDDLVIAGQPQVGRALLYWRPPSGLSQVALLQGWQGRWQAKLKPLHSQASAGAFDFEAWGLSKGLRLQASARGQVEWLSQHSSWRGRLAEDLQQRLDAEQPAATSGKALLRALLLADRRGLQDQHWQRLQASGLAHLVAISGLHLGLVFAWSLAVAAWLLSRLPPPWRPLNRWPWQSALALLAALGYVQLAGWGLPATRAWLMLAAVVVSYWLPWQLSAWSRLMLALLLILLSWPAAPLGVDFWLSAWAVLILLWVLGNRVGSEPWWRQAWRSQWALSVAMLPLLVGSFAQFSLIALPLNLLAVPLLGIVLLPAALLAWLLYWLSPEWGGELLGVVAWGLEGLWQGLGWTLQWGGYGHWQGQPGWLALSLAMLGGLLLVAPAGLLPWRPWAWLLWLPLLWPRVSHPLQEGEWQATVLDVGQGNAVVVRTANHVLLYDTGPAWGSSPQAERIIWPYLSAQGLLPERIVVSHDDSDHSGGASWLRARYPQALWWAGQPQGLSWPAEPCQAQWQWDGVQFELWQAPLVNFADDNEASCLLRVQGQHQLWLLGDISAQAERALLPKLRELGPVDALLAAHHGSRYSSSLDFIRATEAKLAIFSSGYRNHFGHPHPDTLARFHSLGIDTYNTGAEGSLALLSQAQGLQIQGYRQQAGRFWWQLAAE